MGSVDIMNGFNNDDLLAIGTRQRVPDLNISATDINKTVPFVIARDAMAKMDGISEEQLQNIAERKINIIGMPDANTTPNIQLRDLSDVENILSKLQRFLGVRTK